MQHTDRTLAAAAAFMFQTEFSEEMQKFRRFTPGTKILPPESSSVPKLPSHSWWSKFDDKMLMECYFFYYKNIHSFDVSD